MSKYYRGKRKSRTEKIGFYTALTICIVAVSMAVYSTYNTLNTSSNVKTSQSATEYSTHAVIVNEAVTGVTEFVPEPTIGNINPTLPTVISESSETESPEAAETSQPSTMDALQTMLSTDLSLDYPTKSGKVCRDYSENSVYYKTLNVWKPHTAVDFEGELGEDVFSMTDGTVTKTYDNAMYGKTVEISVGDAVCIYSGLGSYSVGKGDKVKPGDTVGTIGSVPFEADEKNHIHIAVKINGKYADPLSFLENNE